MNAFRYEISNGQWDREMMFQHNTSPLLMMSLSVNEQWAIGTVMRGFKLWSVDGRQVKDTYTGYLNCFWHLFSRISPAKKDSYEANQ